MAGPWPVQTMECLEVSVSFLRSSDPSISSKMLGSSFWVRQLLGCYRQNVRWTRSKHIITPTSTPNSRLSSIGHTLCLFSLNATRDPNRCAMPLWFHSILNPNGDDMHVGFQFESFVYIKPNGGTRPVRFQSAPGLLGTPASPWSPGAAAGGITS